MPIRHGGRLASRASTWPRDHFCRSTRAPRRSWPIRSNEFLPISMPMTAISLLSFWDMACSFALGAPRQLGPLAGLEHGRTIPLAEAGGPNVVRCEISYSITSEVAPWRSLLAVRAILVRQPSHFQLMLRLSNDLEPKALVEKTSAIIFHYVQG